MAAMVVSLAAEVVAALVATASGAVKGLKPLVEQRAQKSAARAAYSIV